MSLLDKNYEIKFVSILLLGITNLIIVFSIIIISYCHIEIKLHLYILINKIFLFCLLFGLGPGDPAGRGGGERRGSDH